MMRWTWAWVAAAVAVGCQQEKQAATTSTRAELRAVSGSTLEVIPAEGQHPYCLVFTVSEAGVIRQLTMARENRSLRCEAGKPVAHTRFRVPAEEGKVRAYVFFTDQRVQAGSVAQQLNDLRDQPKLTAMDFRLPGSATVEVLEFTPQAEKEAVTGTVVGTTDIHKEVDEAESSKDDGVMVVPAGGDTQAPAAAPAGGGATPTSGQGH